MKIYLKMIYFDDFCKNYNQTFMEEPTYSDETGRYYFSKLNIYVNTWNGRIVYAYTNSFQLEDYDEFEIINNWILMLFTIGRYYFEYKEGESNE